MNELANPAEKTATKAQGRAPAFAIPRANIHEQKDLYFLELEMPGVARDGLEVTVENNELTIIGRRSDPALKGDPVYRESRPLDYRRVFDLDPSIDIAKITAKMEQGIVKLTLPKAESVKPRKIAVED